MSRQNIARWEIQTDTGTKKVESERPKHLPEKQDVMYTSYETFGKIKT